MKTIFKFAVCLFVALTVGFSAAQSCHGKTVVIDWIANDSEWGSGVAIRNLSHIFEPISVVFTPVGSAPTSPQYSPAGPWGIWVPTLPKNQTSSAVIVGPDSMAVVATTLNLTRGGYGFIPVRAAQTLGEVVYPYPATMREWLPSPYWTILLKSDNPARYNLAKVQAALQFAAMQIYYEFPDRKDRTLGIVDACPLSGQAAGHPGGSHTSLDVWGTGWDIDVSYYTFGKNNTQVKVNGTENSEIIWSGDQLNAKFDIARNKRFFELVKLYLPQVVIMVDERIKAAVGNLAYIQGDSRELYNHHLHAHIQMGGVINAGAKLP